MSAAIQSLPSSSRDAARLAARLDIPFNEITIHTFPDGEMRVTTRPAAATTIIYASLDRPNDKLIALALAAEALRRGGAKRLVLVAPYLCYMRQDKAFHAGEAISQKVIGLFLARCADRVITVDAHLHRTPDIGAVFPGIESDNLSAGPAISETLRKTGLDPMTVLAGPDAESLPWVRDLAGRLGLSHTVAQKIRRGDRSVAITYLDPACIAGRPALIVDDIVSSGGTIIACANALTAAGATTIDAVVTHALFSEQLCREMTSSGIRSIRSTYSVPHSTNAISLDDLFVDALNGELMRAGTAEISRWE
jgi:ribose-phosphate pyrophosphokinase